jgi:hypothetical protein
MCDSLHRTGCLLFLAIAPFCVFTLQEAQFSQPPLNLFQGLLADSWNVQECVITLGEQIQQILSGFQTGPSQEIQPAG